MAYSFICIVGIIKQEAHLKAQAQRGMIFPLSSLGISCRLNGLGLLDVYAGCAGVWALEAASLAVPTPSPPSRSQL